MLLLALGGNMVSMLTAYLLGFNRDEIKKRIVWFQWNLGGHSCRCVYDTYSFDNRVDGAGFVVFNGDCMAF